MIEKTFTIGPNTVNPLTINRLGFGTMQLTGPGIWGMPEDIEHGRAVLRQVAEHGVNFIDTADSYGPHTSEELIASSLRPYGDKVIATKAGLVRQGPNRWEAVGAPAYLEQCLELSLRRLKTDHLDLWQLHRIDPHYPLADQVGVFAQAVVNGKVKQIGLSEVTAQQLLEALEIAPISTVQNRYNLAERGSEEVLQICEARGIGFIPWFPLADGTLTNDPRLLAVANRLGATANQVALAWLLAKSNVMLPIPGTSNLAHLAENCAAADLDLSPEIMAELAQIAQ